MHLSSVRSFITLGCAARLRPNEVKELFPRFSERLRDIRSGSTPGVSGMTSTFTVGYFSEWQQRRRYYQAAAEGQPASVTAGLPASNVVRSMPAQPSARPAVNDSVPVTSSIENAAVEAEPSVPSTRPSGATRFVLPSLRSLTRPGLLWSAYVKNNPKAATDLVRHDPSPRSLSIALRTIDNARSKCATMIEGYPWHKNDLRKALDSDEHQILLMMENAPASSGLDIDESACLGPFVVPQGVWETLRTPRLTASDVTHERAHSIARPFSRHGSSISFGTTNSERTVTEARAGNGFRVRLQTPDQTIGPEPRSRHGSSSSLSSLNSVMSLAYTPDWLRSQSETEDQTISDNPPSPIPTLANRGSAYGDLPQDRASSGNSNGVRTITVEQANSLMSALKVALSKPDMGFRRIGVAAKTEEQPPAAATPDAVTAENHGAERSSAPWRGPRLHQPSE